MPVTFRYLIIAVSIATLATWRLQDIYVHHAGQKPKTHANACIYEDDCLFAKALKLNLIRSKNQIVQVLPIDAIDRKQKTDTVLTLEDLHFSEPGRVIQKEIKRWNDSRLIAAVRHQKYSAIQQSEFAQLAWISFEERAQKNKTRAQRFQLVSDDVVPEDFGYVHPNELQHGFSDWRAVHGIQTNVLFQSEFNPNADQAEFGVQIIGRLQSAIFLQNGQVIKRVESDAWEPRCDLDVLKTSSLPCTPRNATAGQIHINLESVDPNVPITAQIRLK